MRISYHKLFRSTSCQPATRSDTHLQFAQWIHNGEIALAGQGGQCKYRNTNGNVFEGFADATHLGAECPTLLCIDDASQWHTNDNDQQISQGQRQNIAATNCNSRQDKFI